MHMLNEGGPKPAYNVNSSRGIYCTLLCSNDRINYNTLIPVLEKHKKNLEVAEEVTQTAVIVVKKISYI